MRRRRNLRRGGGVIMGQVVYFFAAALGQYLVSVGEIDDYRIYSVVAMLITLSLVPLALTRSEAPVIELSQRLGFRGLYRLSPSGLFGGLTAGVVVSCFVALAPVYASAIGMNVTANLYADTPLELHAHEFTPGDGPAAPDH